MDITKAVPFFISIINICLVQRSQQQDLYDQPINDEPEYKPPEDSKGMVGTAVWSVLGIILAFIGSVAIYLLFCRRRRKLPCFKGRQVQGLGGEEYKARLPETIPFQYQRQIAVSTGTDPQ